MKNLHVLWILSKPYLYGLPQQDAHPHQIMYYSFSYLLILTKLYQYYFWCPIITKKLPKYKYNTITYEPISYPLIWTYQILNFGATIVLGNLYGSLNVASRVSFKFLQTTINFYQDYGTSITKVFVIRSTFYVTHAEFNIWCLWRCSMAWNHDHTDQK